MEEATKDQATSRMWYAQRAGRITVSRFKAAAKTDLSQPSQSTYQVHLLSREPTFKSRATEWSCTHERDALAAYQQQEEPNHRGFNMSHSGLVLSTCQISTHG